MTQYIKEGLDRNAALLSIRPVLQLDQQETLPLEQFQNQVLRPILKFQNAILLQCFRMSSQFLSHLTKVDKTNIKTLESGVFNFLKSNHHFRNKIFGIVLGLMTEDEVATYHTNTAEYNRRITSMLVKRVAGQLEAI